MNLATLAVTEETSVANLWWVPLLGVVVGALLGGAAQLGAELLRARNTRNEALWNARQEAEILALMRAEEAIHSVRETLATVSGSDGNPEDDESQMTVVSSLFDAERKLKIQGIVVHGIGSRAVSEVLNEIPRRLREFLVTSAETGGIRGQDAAELLGDLDDLMDALIERVRGDLRPSAGLELP